MIIYTPPAGTTIDEAILRAKRMAISSGKTVKTCINDVDLYITKTGKLENYKLIYLTLKNLEYHKQKQH